MTSHILTDFFPTTTQQSAKNSNNWVAMPAIQTPGNNVQPGMIIRIIPKTDSSSKIQSQFLTAASVIPQQSKQILLILKDGNDLLVTKAPISALNDFNDSDQIYQ